MIPELRKRHKWMWLILTILLPLGFITAYSLILKPAVVTNEQLLTSKPIPLTKVVSNRQTPQFDVSLREDNGLGMKQIEIKVKENLTLSSTHIYLSDKSSLGIENTQFLGVLTPEKVHRFNLDPSMTYQNAYVVLFYDEIAEELYEEVQLE